MAFHPNTTVAEMRIDFATNSTAVKNAIAVDHTHGYIYWSSKPNINRAKLNGSPSEEIVTGTYA